MSAKTLLPNQCTPLHFLYGANNCCLCTERMKVLELEQRVKDLENLNVSNNPRIHSNTKIRY